MNTLAIKSKIKEVLESSLTYKISSFITFTIILTAIISSQNFFFQNIVENGISKRDVITPKTLTVVDVKRTEQLKKEAAQRIEPVLAPAEDDFIKNNLHTLQSSVWKIREKNIPHNEKESEIAILFDLTNNSQKDFIVNFLLKTDDASLREAFEKSTMTLSNILRSGITEKEFEQNNIDKIIIANLVANVSKRQVTVIKALIEQVIVPNLVVDEFATEIQRKNAQNSVKPYEVIFSKGDKILFEGEPVTRLKRDALRQAGYNVYELNFYGLAAIYVIVFLATLLFLSYMKFFEKEYLEPKYLSITAFMSIMLALIGVLFPTGLSPYLLPVPAFLIIVSIFTKPRIAFVAASILLCIMSIGYQYNVQYLVAFMLLSLVSAALI